METPEQPIDLMIDWHIRALEDPLSFRDLGDIYAGERFVLRHANVLVAGKIVEDYNASDLQARAAILSDLADNAPNSISGEHFDNGYLFASEDLDALAEDEVKKFLKGARQIAKERQRGNT